MRRLIVDALDGEGYAVHDVADGAAMLIELARNDVLRPCPVDLVVSDVYMPGCSGLKALETIRAVRPDLPFLILTACRDPAVEACARELGAVVLDKPVRMQRLRGVIAGLLRARPSVGLG